MWGEKMRAALAGFVLAMLVVTAMPAHSQPSGETGMRCDGPVLVSNIAPPSRGEATQWRLYVRGSGARVRYYAFGLLPDDPYSAHAEQAMLRALGVDPASRIGDAYPSLEAAEKGALEHCRAAQRAR